LYLYRIQPGSATARAGVADMRECIEACAAWDGWSDIAQNAFRQKILSLRYNETLYAVAEHLRKGDLFGATRRVITNPEVLRILPRRIFGYLGYQVHRFRYGGTSRTSRKGQ